ncbi:MAG: hypothetical protein KC466_05475 [Myxococcales bacterium]|nr:hypothetical protein [Myxococcales bacterium]
MKRIEYAAVALMASAVMIGASLAQAAEPTHPMSPTMKSTTPMGKMDAKRADAYGRSLPGYFAKAKAEFLKQDSSGAASEIRAAQTWFKAEADRATGERKDALGAMARDLGGLAGRVEQKSAIMGSDLEHEFARAHEVLARSYAVRASEMYAQKSFTDAGRDLTAAAMNFERAAQWAGTKVEGSTLSSVTEARKIGIELEHGKRPVAEAVQKSIGDLRASIEKFGAEHPSTPAQPATTPLVN